MSLQSLIIRRNTLFKLPWCCTPPNRFIKMKFWYPSTVTLLCIPPNSCISFSNRKAFFTSSVIGMQDIKLRQSPIGCWKMEFNHFFRIPVPRPKKAFFGKHEFAYDEYYDCYICPGAHILTYSTTNKSGYKEYKSCGEHCAECQCLSKMHRK